MNRCGTWLTTPNDVPGARVGDHWGLCVVLACLRVCCGVATRQLDLREHSLSPIAAPLARTRLVRYANTAPRAPADSHGAAPLAPTYPPRL